MSPHVPKRPAGTVPGKEFVNEHEPHGIKVGIITRVDEINMKADVHIITGGSDQYEVELTQAMSGPRSFWGGVPEENSMVILGYRRKSKDIYEAVILGYIPVGNISGARFDPLSPDDLSNILEDEKDDFFSTFGTTVRHKRLTLHKGDVGGMSSDGAELALSRDVRLCNRAGDLLELRDSERSLVAQAIHRVDSEAGVFSSSGPLRRGAMNLPQDVFKTGSRILKSTSEKYYGRDELQAIGPTGSTLCDLNGKVLERMNEDRLKEDPEFPPVTYDNGKQWFYPVTTPGKDLDTVLDPDGKFPGFAFTEVRTQMLHTTDLHPDVLAEIDGFQMDYASPYIEHVMGTIVGNDPYSEMGQRQYGRILRPHLFDDYHQNSPAKFNWEEVDRSPASGDQDIYTAASCFLFKMVPPQGTSDNPLIFTATKEGKVVVNLPGSQTEKFPSGAQNISLEAMLHGGIKAYIGAAMPDHLSFNLTCEGGIKLDVGGDKDGNALDITYHSGVKQEFKGVQNLNDIALSEAVTGAKEQSVSGDHRQTTAGNKTVKVGGKYAIKSDILSVNSTNAFNGTYGSESITVNGKTSHKYADAVEEKITLGGYKRSITTGGATDEIVAGGFQRTVLSGDAVHKNTAGDYKVEVTQGAISISTKSGAFDLVTKVGDMSVEASAGSISMTAGLSITLAAKISCTLNAKLVYLGGDSSSATLGVCRGSPSMPNGSPTLDPITGAPLLGSIFVKSV